VRPVPVGTAADTPTSLRLKVAEFLRIADATVDPWMQEECNRLAAIYAASAAEIEAAAASVVVATPASAKPKS
jgi:hypothetical protein